MSLTAINLGVHSCVQFVSFLVVAVLWVVHLYIIINSIVISLSMHMTIFPAQYTLLEGW